MKSVKEIRVERNLTSTKMANELGMPLSTYTDKESGRRKFQPLEIVRICQMFNVRVEDIKNFYVKDIRNKDFGELNKITI